jgi:hypothetical protein
MIILCFLRKTKTDEFAVCRQSFDTVFANNADKLHNRFDVDGLS